MELYVLVECLLSKGDIYISEVKLAIFWLSTSAKKGVQLKRGNDCRPLHEKRNEKGSKPVRCPRKRFVQLYFATALLRQMFHFSCNRHCILDRYWVNFQLAQLKSAWAISTQYMDVTFIVLSWHRNKPRSLYSGFLNFTTVLTKRTFPDVKSIYFS